VESYLQRKHIPLKISTQIIEYLTRQKLIDDETFTQEFIRSKLNQGRGLHRIQLELKTKHINSDIISKQFNQIDIETVTQSARNIIHKKSRLFNKLNGYQKLNKIKQYLYQRGFDAQIIRAIIDEINS
jgi:SOS response regulatory protein OraA/RecX